MTNTIAKLMPLFGAALLTACASKPPAPPKVEAPKIKSGEQMLLESQGMAQMGERWMEGQKKVQQGEEMVRQGQATIDQGQRLIEEGRKIMQESEDSYQSIRK